MRITESQLRLIVRQTLLAETPRYTSMAKAIEYLFDDDPKMSKLLDVTISSLMDPPALEAFKVLKIPQLMRDKGRGYLSGHTNPKQRHAQYDILSALYSLK